MLNYKKLAEILKYSHDAFNSILRQMNYHDFAGDEHADHTKRGVLADAYEEATNDTEGANHLRTVGQPVIHHENRIEPASIKNIVLYNPRWDQTDTSSYSPQELMDYADNWHNKDFHLTRPLGDPIVIDNDHIDSKGRGMHVVHGQYVFKRILLPKKSNYNNNNNYNIKTGKIT